MAYSKQQPFICFNSAKNKHTPLSQLFYRCFQQLHFGDINIKNVDIFGKPYIMHLKSKIKEDAPS